MRSFLLFLLLTVGLQAQYGRWQRIDDVDLYGYHQLFVLDDSAAYLMSRYALYRSDDGGRFWREVVSPGRSEAISFIEPDPASGPSALVMAANVRLNDKGTEGVFTSSDGGITWNYHGGAVGNGGGYVYAAGLGSFYMTCGPDYMVHVDHLGVARKYVDGIPTSEVTHIRHFATFDDDRALCYTWPGTVYVSGSGWAPWHQNWAPANTGLGNEEVLYIYSEGNDAWAALAVSGIKRAKRPSFIWQDASDGLGAPGSPSMYVRRIFRDKRGPLMALTAGGYYRSTDGDHWTPVGGMLPDYGKPGRTAIDFQGRYFVLYGQDSVLVSEDEARTWELRMTGLGMDSVRDILIQDGKLYAAGAHCLFTTATHNQLYAMHWSQSIEGLADPRIRTLAARPDSSVIAFGMDGLVYRLPRGSTTWIPLSGDLSGESVTAAASGAGGLLLAGTERGAVAVSRDGGTAWEFMQRSISSVPVRSVLAVSDSLLLAGTFGEGLQRSTDAGMSWYRVTNGLTHPNITALLQTPDGDLYAGSYGAGVFRSSDLGLTWAPTASASPGQYVTAMVTNYIGVLAVATFDGGVCRSQNDGLRWDVIYPDQNILHYVRLQHAPYQNRLFAVAADGALYGNYAGLATPVDEREIPAGFELREAYPNPFRDRIEVEIAMHGPGSLRIALTDMLGRQIVVQEEQVRETGSFHRTLTVASLPAGAYLLTAEAGGERRIRLLTHFR
ncbi:MAG: T9SS type A sorting domain-containing protein [Bacteroidetes bacterium]|nr:T9SS type A sorting domain-containing protein [Bacteroidota bacterium]